MSRMSAQRPGPTVHVAVACRQHRQAARGADAPDGGSVGPRQLRDGSYCTPCGPSTGEHRCGEA